MTVSPEEIFEQFKNISGINGSENDDKLRLLLESHDYNLNNALSVYFDSGFESLNQASVTTGVDFHEEETELSRRRQHELTPDLDSFTSANQSSEFTNLQSQMFMQDLIPKLPKASKISNKWQLDLGIYASMNEKLEITESQSSKKPMNLWIILLIIPKSLLQLLVSVFKFFFVSPSYDVNKFPKKYNFDQYEQNYTFQSWIENNDGQETIHEGSSLMEKCSVVELDSETKVNQEEELSIFDIYNIKDSNFNECHQLAQKQYIWLIVILINDSQDNVEWLKSLLRTKTFQTNFNQKDGTYKENVMYINNINKSPESWEVGQEYRVRRLPYIMVIGNVSNNPAILSSMSIIYKSNLILGEDYNQINRKINRNLNKVFDLYNPQLITSRFDQQEIEFSRLMVQQQNDAYEQSLNQDREKKLIKQQLQQQLEQEKTNQLIKQKFINFNILHDDYLSTIKGNIKMAIKLPSGTRITESFNELITLQQLYLFIELKMYQDENKNEQHDENEHHNGNEHHNNENDIELISHSQYFKQFPFNFELIQPFPKKIIDCDETQINQVKELRSGANLFVEYKD